MIKVSVIVPVYQVKEYLEECILSICNQTLRDVEIIIIDDGSKDGSEILCDELAKQDARIKVIHQKNRGLSAARNVGIEIAKGEYISFIDSDDCISADFLEILYNLCKETNSEISAVSYRRIDQNSKKEYLKKVSYDETIRIFDRKQALIEHLITTSIDVIACNKMYKKEIFNNIRYPDGMLFEDMLTTYRLINEANRIAFVKAPLYCYRKRNGSIGNSVFKKSWYGMSDAIESAYGFVCRQSGKSDDLICAYMKWKMAFVNKLILFKVDDEKTVTEIQNIIKKEFFTIIKNKRLELQRKIELILFAYSYKIYSYVYRCYKARIKV